MKAIERIQDKNIMGNSIYQKVITITQEEEESLHYIHKIFRNKFEHYAPLSWSIEIEIFIKPLNDLISVIDKVVSDPNFRHIYKNEASEAKDEIEKAKIILNQAEADYR